MLNISSLDSCKVQEQEQNPALTFCKKEKTGALSLEKCPVLYKRRAGASFLKSRLLLSAGAPLENSASIADSYRSFDRFFFIRILL